MDWVECNNCTVKPSQSKLHLTKCMHVLCQNCVAKALSTTQNCAICGKILETCEIGKNLPAECMDLFKDVRQIAAESYEELKRVVKFQTGLREFYVKVKNAQTVRDSEAFNNARKKREWALQEIEKHKRRITEEEERLKAAKVEKKRLTERLRNLKRQLPIPDRFVAPMVPRKISENSQDQSISKIATSTPIISAKFSRREYMNRLFAAGETHPSPIPRDL